MVIVTVGLDFCEGNSINNAPLLPLRICVHLWFQLLFLEPV